MSDAKKKRTANHTRLKPKLSINGKPIGTIIKIIDNPSKTNPARKTKPSINNKVPHAPNSQNAKIDLIASKPPDDRNTLANIVPPTTIVKIIAVTSSVFNIASINMVFENVL